MKKSKIGVISLIFVFWFILWTILIAIIDVNAIGPNGSKVGFSVLNKFVHNFFGVNYALYIITDWLGLIPVAVCLGFAFLGAIQWIKRKRILKVDKDILLISATETGDKLADVNNDTCSIAEVSLIKASGINPDCK